MGRARDEPPKDQWQARCGLGQTIEYMAPLMNNSQVNLLILICFNFLFNLIF